MSPSQRKYIFGPVPSRRLGRSLGVDLVPHKVCSFDCIYCQVGRTTVKTTRRDAYAPTDEVLAELREVLSSGVACDYVTLSGSGEPTLHADLGRIISAIKTMTDVPVAVLTNGSLLGDPAVRSDLAQADLVVPSLDAGDAETFEKINRPCEGIDFDSYVQALKDFRSEFAGRLHLEVFLAAGVNDDEEQVGRIRALIDEIGPDHVDVNTVARPTADADVQAVAPDRLRRLCELLGPLARIVVPAPERLDTAGTARPDEVLAMLRRRPCTLDDLAVGLDCRRDALAELLDELIRDGCVVSTDQQGRTYFCAPPDAPC